MSRQNNVGSHGSSNYDYASHHADPFGSNRSGDDRYSSLDAFNDESQADKEMSLGYGTKSPLESQKKHQAAMEALLSTLDVDGKLEQKPAEESSGEQKNARS